MSNPLVLNTVPLRRSAEWCNINVQHIHEHLKKFERLYDVCVDNLDLILGLSYTPRWLDLDGPNLALRPGVTTSASQRELLTKLKRATVAYRAIVQVCDSFFPDVKSKNFGRLRQSRVSLWIDIVNLSLRNELEKNLKEDFQQLLAYGTKKVQTRSGICVFSGYLKRLVCCAASRMSQPGRRGVFYASFVRSLYESKRCWTEMSSDLEIQAMEKHKKLLTSEKSVSDKAKLWIKRAVDLVFPPGTSYFPEASCVPTWSASFETGRSDGGNHSAVLGAGKNFQVGEPWCQKAFSDELLYRTSVQGMEEENDVRFQSIPEPGKFRIITVGREALYTSFRQFQSFMISKWKMCRYGTMTDNVLEKILKLRKRDGEIYFSGDYDSATDALSIDATLTAMGSILENVGLSKTLLGANIMKSFSGANIHYPVYKDGTLIKGASEVLKQTRGQLMGHPLSFVLLCIINLSTYMRAHRTTGILKNVLINGDDILFKSNEGAGRKWRNAADDVGLIVNEAKTYQSNRWALINSIFVDMESGEKVEYIPFSCALGWNVKKGESNRTLDQAPAIWELIMKLKSIPKGMHRSDHRCIGKCIRVYWKVVKRLCSKIKGFTPNYFLHKDLGGLGMKPCEGWRYGVSGLQARVANYFLQNREVIAFREKYTELPKAVMVALEKCRRMLPKSEPWLISGRPVQGPLDYLECAQTYAEKVLGFCLRSCAYIVGPPKDRDYALISHYYKALQCKSSAISKIKKLKTYAGALFKYPVQDRTYLGVPEQTNDSIEYTEEESNDYEFEVFKVEQAYLREQESITRED